MDDKNNFYECVDKACNFVFGFCYLADVFGIIGVKSLTQNYTYDELWIYGLVILLLFAIGSIAALIDPKYQRVCKRQYERKKLSKLQAHVDSTGCFGKGDEF